jgi:hypothetical protein
VLQFSESTAIGNKSIEDVRSAPIPTRRMMIGDGSIDRSALQDMGAWSIRIFLFLSRFYGKERN